MILLGIDELRQPHQEDWLDMSSITGCLTLLLSPHNMYIMSHTTSTWPLLHKHTPLSSLSLPDTAMFAGIISRYESAGVIVNEVLVATADGVMQWMVMVGDQDVVTVQPVNADGDRVRVSDTVVIKKSGGMLSRVNANEEPLFTPTANMVLNRRTVISDGDRIVFIADHDRVLKFDRHCLSFAVTMTGAVVGLTLFGGEYLVAVTDSGTVAVYSRQSGYLVSEEHITMCTGERMIGCAESVNGVLVMTNKRLFRFKWTTVHCGPTIGILPYGNKVSPLGPLIPKEYNDAAPWRQLVKQDDLVALIGRFGMAIYNQPLRKWTILHPRSQQLFHFHHITITKDGQLIATVTVVSAEGAKRHELRVYNITSDPITLQSCTSLGAQPRLLTANNEHVAVLDTNRQLSIHNRNAQLYVADLADSAVTQLVLTDHGAVWFKSDSGSLYRVNQKALVDNPAMCTVASVVREGRVQMVKGLDDAVLVLEWDGEECSVLWSSAYFGTLLLCKTDSAVVDFDIEWIYYQNGRKKALFPHLFVNILGIGSANTDQTQMVMAHLEQCLYECFKKDLLDPMLDLIGRSDELHVAVGRVARTLEYSEALKLISSCHLTLRDLFTVYKKMQSAPSLTLLYKLLIEDHDTDWTLETVRALLECGAVEDAVQVYQLAERLQVDLVSTCGIITEYYIQAHRRGDLVSCHLLQPIINTTTDTSVDNFKRMASEMVIKYRKKEH